MTKKRGLGRGLDALLGGTRPVKDNLKKESQSDHEQLRQLDIDQLQPGEYQPRRDMHPASLEELADSIRAQGLVQPIVVRTINQTHSDKAEFEIIAGERRWRAAQLAGLDKIPAIVRQATDRETIAMALIENIQREDLNPIEEAEAISRLIKEFELTHQQAAEAVGRSRAAVSNLLRLLELSPEVKILLENDDLEMGHARALLPLEKKLQLELAQLIIAKSLTVREAEQLVRRQANKTSVVEKPKIDPDVESMQQQLAEQLGAKVTFRHNQKGKGKLMIEYNSLEQLDGILKHIN